MITSWRSHAAEVHCDLGRQGVDVAAVERPVAVGSDQPANGGAKVQPHRPDAPTPSPKTT